MPYSWYRIDCSGKSYESMLRILRFIDGNTYGSEPPGANPMVHVELLEDSVVSNVDKLCPELSDCPIIRLPK